ncbi:MULTISPECIES: 50S ribosomal protein L9 [Glycomyces]|jgi:large subunit ribosomal protein L9|uniref:Large ribosomal subunit protein bL9 n=2 Tax=Glycomyces TaxID=58113 RepID=A0A9X3T9E6_9ACTN|nr:50S ribosomal protein L9 [Glycomyces lechevalierae]MDA1386398.1 50S ribosomal protein L9 [Glycomyces lechevalierae]MDR7338914.1 large subunit ribosomal protein L9 [Glycomyces lechevalierae]
MKIILTHEVPNLGSAGDVVEVKNGYGRNYLLPQGLAIAWTKGGQKEVDAIQRARAARQIHDLDQARALAEQLKKTDAHIVARTGDGDRLFGSITAVDIVKAVDEAGGPKIDRRRVELSSTIKSVGTYDVSVKLHPEVTAKFKLQVTPAKRRKK